MILKIAWSHEGEQRHPWKSRPNVTASSSGGSPGRGTDTSHRPVGLLARHERQGLAETCVHCRAQKTCTAGARAGSLRCPATSGSTRSVIQNANTVTSARRTIVAVARQTAGGRFEARMHAPFVEFWSQLRVKLNMHRTTRTCRQRQPFRRACSARPQRPRVRYPDVVLSVVLSTARRSLRSRLARRPRQRAIQRSFFCQS
jgi:hypothetical protein